MRVGGSGTYHKPLRWYKMALTKSQTQEVFLLVCNNNLSTYKAKNCKSGESLQRPHLKKSDSDNWTSILKLGCKS